LALGSRPAAPARKLKAYAAKLRRLFCVITVKAKVGNGRMVSKKKEDEEETEVLE
jgi:hypothetical protein